MKEKIVIPCCYKERMAVLMSDFYLLFIEELYSTKLIFISPQVNVWSMEQLEITIDGETGEIRA